MALSNWDTLAVTHEGEPSSGTFESPSGVRVVVYKNWLYIRDEDGWTEGNSYAEPTVMEVHNGSLRYKDVKIAALRGPQNGVFAVVWSGYAHRDGLRGMVACGVYGYEGEDWVGVSRESLEWFRNKLTGTKMVRNPMLDILEQNDPAMGALGHMMLKPKVEGPEWEPHIGIPDELREVSFEKAVRHNQGDAYFAEKLNFDIPATKPGEAKDTILGQIKPVVDMEEE